MSKYGNDYYVCDNCGEVFREDEADYYLDDPSPRGISLPSGYIRIDTCPWCGSEDLSTAPICECCENPHNGKKSEYFCPSCFEAFEEIENQAVEAATKRFQFPAKDVLYTWFQRRIEEE